MQKKLLATPAIAGLVALPIAGYTAFYLMEESPFRFDAGEVAEAPVVRQETTAAEPAKEKEAVAASESRDVLNRLQVVPEAAPKPEAPANYAMPQADVRLQPRPPQIQIAIPQADVFRHRRVFSNLKRRRLRFVQQLQLARQHFHFAGQEFRVHGVRRPPLDEPAHADHVLGAQPLCLREQFVVAAEDDLGHSLPVADIDEKDTAQIADAVNPPEQGGVGVEVGGAELPAGVGSSPVAERFCHSLT